MIRFRGEQSRLQQETKVAEKLQEFKNAAQIQSDLENRKTEYLQQLSAVANKIADPSISSNERLASLQQQNDILKNIQSLNVTLTGFVGRQKEFAQQLQSNKEVQQSVAAVLHTKSPEQVETILKSKDAITNFEETQQQLAKNAQYLQNLRNETQQELVISRSIPTQRSVFASNIQQYLAKTTQSTAPEGSVLAAPEGSFPTAPEGSVLTAPEGNVPTAPVSEGNVPTAPVPEGNVPTPPVSEGNVPTAPVPEGNVPTPPVPEGNVPTPPVPEGNVPTAPVPAGSAPTAPVPEGSAPTAPVPGGSAPTAPVPGGNVAPILSVPSVSSGLSVPPVKPVVVFHLAFEDTFTQAIKNAEELKIELKNLWSGDVGKTEINTVKVSTRSEFEVLQQKEKHWHNLFRLWQSAMLTTAGMATTGTATVTVTDPTILWAELMQDTEGFKTDVETFLRNTITYPSLPTLRFESIKNMPASASDKFGFIPLILIIHKIILIENITSQFLIPYTHLSENVEACYMLEEVTSFLNSVDSTFAVSNCSQTDEHKKNLAGKDEIRTFIEDALNVQKQYLGEVNDLAKLITTTQLQAEITRNLELTSTAIDEVVAYMKTSESTAHCSETQKAWELIQKFWEMWFNNILDVLLYFTRLKNAFQFHVPEGFHALSMTIMDWSRTKDSNIACKDPGKWASDLIVFKKIIEDEKKNIVNLTIPTVDDKFTAEQADRVEKLKKDAIALLSEQRKNCTLTTLNQQEKNRCKEAIIKLERVVEESTNLLILLPDIVVQNAVNEGVLMTTPDSNVILAKKLADEKKLQEDQYNAKLARDLEEVKKKQDEEDKIKQLQDARILYAQEIENKRLDAIQLAKKREEDNKKIEGIIKAARNEEVVRKQRDQKNDCQLPSIRNDLTNKIFGIPEQNFCDDLQKVGIGDLSRGNFRDVCDTIHDQLANFCTQKNQQYDQMGSLKYPNDAKKAEIFGDTAKLYGPECAEKIINRTGAPLNPAQRNDFLLACRKETGFIPCEKPTMGQYGPMVNFIEYIGTLAVLRSQIGKRCSDSNNLEKQAACKNAKQCDVITDLRDKVLVAAENSDGGTEMRNKLDRLLPSSQNCLSMCDTWQKMTWDPERDCAALFPDNEKVVEHCKLECKNDYNVLCTKAHSAFQCQTRFKVPDDEKSDEAIYIKPYFEECEKIRKECTGLQECIYQFDALVKKKAQQDRGGKLKKPAS